MESEVIVSEKRLKQWMSLYEQSNVVSIGGKTGRLEIILLLHIKSASELGKRGRLSNLLYEHHRFKSESGKGGMLVKESYSQLKRNRELGKTEKPIKLL